MSERPQTRFTLKIKASQVRSPPGYVSDVNNEWLLLVLVKLISLVSGSRNTNLIGYWI